MTLLLRLQIFCFLFLAVGTTHGMKRSRDMVDAPLRPQNVYFYVRTTLLIEAIRQGSVAVALRLMQSPWTDLNARDGHYGMTPLLWAVEKELLEVVRELLSRPNTDLAACDMKGRTILAIALEKGSEAVIREILRCTQIIDRHMALFKWALLHNMVVVQRVLIDHFSPFEIHNALRIALSWGCEYIVPELCKAPAAKEAFIALGVCLEADAAALARILLNAGISVNTRGATGTTALHLAVNDNEEVVHLLLNTPGIDINIRDNNGVTPLIEALSIGQSPQIVKDIIATPYIDVNAQDTHGNTALMTFVANLNMFDEHKITWQPNALQSLRELLKAPGINVNLPDNLGMTPLMFCLSSGYENPNSFFFHTPENPAYFYVQIITLLSAAGAQKIDNQETLNKVGIAAYNEGHEMYMKILKALREGDIPTLKLFESLGFSLCVQDKEGKSALHIVIDSKEIATEEQMERVVEYVYHYAPGLVALEHYAPVLRVSENRDGHKYTQEKYLHNAVYKAVLRYGPGKIVLRLLDWAYQKEREHLFRVWWRAQSEKKSACVEAVKERIKKLGIMKVADQNLH